MSKKCQWPDELSSALSRLVKTLMFACGWMRRMLGHDFGW
jgi:hypothetical protein